LPTLTFLGVLLFFVIAIAEDTYSERQVKQRIRMFKELR
jgi:hypothetical protein